MKLFESLNLAKHALLKESSPIKDLISKVNNNNDSPLNALLSTINKNNWKIGKKAIELLIKNNADINKISESNKNILKFFI